MLLSWCMAAPASFAVFYKLWMLLGQIMNRISNFILLGIIFYLVITPMGLIIRKGARTQVKLDRDETADSYRVTSITQQKDDMKRPF